MIFKALLATALALSLASATPAAKRQGGTTIHVQLRHSTLNTTRDIRNVPLDDSLVPVDPPFQADIVDAECTGGCRIGFHCTLYGPHGAAAVQVPPGETQFIFDAFATIAAVSCAAGLPAKRQDDDAAAAAAAVGGLTVTFTNDALAESETLRLDADGAPRAVGFARPVDAVATACAEVCIPELAYHCELRDRTPRRRLVGTLAGPGVLRFPADRQPLVGQITCYDDFGGGGGDDGDDDGDGAAAAAAAAATARSTGAAAAVQGTVVFSNAQGDFHEDDLVLDEWVVLPESILPVVYTDGTVVLTQDQHDRIWSCRAFARGRAPSEEAFVDLGVFFANERFIKTFVGGEVYAWKCD